MESKKEKFLDDYFDLLGNVHPFIEMLGHVISDTSWCNDFIGFEFPEDYDEYEAKKAYLAQHENFQIENSICIHINPYFIPCEIDRLIIEKSVFIAKLIQISFNGFTDFGFPSKDEVKKAVDLINELKSIYQL